MLTHQNSKQLLVTKHIKPYVPVHYTPCPGHCKYVPEQSAAVWTIKSFPGGKEYLMKAHFFLPSVDGDLTEGKPPINVKFEIPYFTTSGIQVGAFA